MEKIEVEKEYIENLEKSLLAYQNKYKALNNLNLTKKDITKLRKQLQENEKFNTNYLRLISIYTDTNDEILKLYINKIYLSLNS
jgi:DNA-dependent RNA polymerase auxiliary subunit epsilon